MDKIDRAKTMTVEGLEAWYNRLLWDADHHASRCMRSDARRRAKTIEPVVMQRCYGITAKRRRMRGGRA